MKLYIVRHGESETNAVGRWTGWLNPALTEKGIADARRARKLLEGVQFDKVYASDLIRAVQTAKEMLPDCAPEETALLREINVGDLAGKTVAEMHEKYGDALAQHRIDTDYSAYGGENAEQFDGRITEFLHTVEGCGCETVAAFAHAGVLRRMWKVVTGSELVIERVLCLNCAILILDYTNGVWKIHSWINL